MKSEAWHNLTRNPLAWLLGISLPFWAWETTLGIPDFFQWIFFGVVLIGWGIPHGAVDHLVEAQNARFKGEKFGLASFLVKYLGWIVLLGFAWWLMPVVSLSIFLLISALHFGETDLEPIIRAGNFSRLLYIIYGLAVLSVLLVPNLIEVGEILEGTVPGSWTGKLSSFAPIAQIVALILGIVAGVGVLLSRKSSEKLVSFFVIGLILLVLWQLPLKISFALYFGGIHSLGAFRDIKNYLGKTRPNWNWIGFVRALMPLSLLAIPGTLMIGALGMFFLNPVMMVFIFVASLTVPHVFVMQGMYRLRRNESASP